MDLDPDYALARAYRGFADVVASGYDDTPPELLRRAQEMATEAVRMDEHDARCCWLLGLIHFYCGNLREEEQHYRRALALNPNDANALATLGAAMAGRGRHQEGIDHVRAAMRLNPHHPEWYWTTLGNMFYAAHRYEDSLEAYGHKSNRNYWVMSRFAACYAQLGRMEEARAAAAEVIRLKPAFAISELRRASRGDGDAEHLRDGMRKAGLPEWLAKGRGY
jgi:tetratricopeptide (TPR) repeat protein